MKRLLSLLSLMICLSLQAQMINISGTIRDSHSHERLPSVSVMGVGTQIGTVTNSEGKFILKLPSSTQEIIVSHIGYKNRRIPVEDESRLDILLKPDAIVLDEIVVSSPEEILEQAIRHIPDNYAKVPNILRTFYRETTQKGRRYIYVAEAVADMYKTSYTKGIVGDRVEILKGRRVISPQKKDTLGAKIVGGPTAAVNMDFVKNPEVVLSDEERAHYTFSMEVPARLGGRPQIVISFKPKETLPYALYYGKIYIDRETLTFTRAEINLDMSDRIKATRYMLINKPNGVRFRPRSLTVTVDYKFLEGRSCISYIKTNIEFKCDWKRKLFSSSYRVISEMVVTNVCDENVQSIRRHDSFGPRESFYDHSEYFDDKDFWKDYNIISPTESLDKAVRKLVTSNSPI